MTQICIYIIIVKLYRNVKENRLIYEKKKTWEMHFKNYLIHFLNKISFFYIIYV